jgi:hypothetical protein
MVTGGFVTGGLVVRTTRRQFEQSVKPPKPS